MSLNISGHDDYKKTDTPRVEDESTEKLGVKERIIRYQGNFMRKI